MEIQIRYILDKHFDAILEYLRREHDNNICSDVDDGILFKKNCEKNPSSLKILSLTLNADGATMYNNSRDSLWPVQLLLNFLPPNIRYQHENIIISTLYYGRTKPKMDDLLYLLAREMDFINSTFITFYKKNVFWNFLPVLHLCSCDLPARTAIQNFVAANGKFGCPFCHNPGTPIENNAERTTIRYVQHGATMIKRTHNETVEFAEQAVSNINNKNGNSHGVKGYSSLLMFDEIDIINSFPVDIMHGCGGLAKDIVEIWLGKRKIPNPPYSDYKIKHVKERSILEQRIINFQPTCDFTRKPRPISEITNFKASELFHLLWYYLRYAIVGLLPTRIVKHFEKLSVGTYVLCKKSATMAEIHTACELLKEFANDFENIYGKGAVTMNLHLLNHYEDVIKSCGPIWCYNLFPCENNIGVLKKFVTGPTDLLNQMAAKLSLSRNFDHNSNASEGKKHSAEATMRNKIVLKPEWIRILKIH